MKKILLGISNFVSIGSLIAAVLIILVWAGIELWKETHILYIPIIYYFVIICGIITMFDFLRKK